MAVVAPLVEGNEIYELQWNGYGWGFNPFKALKKAGKKVVKGAKHIVKVASHHPLESVAAIAAISSPFWLPAVTLSLIHI